MKMKWYMLLFFLIAIPVAALVAFGCGGGSSSNTTTLAQSCLQQPSMIPASTGKPQLIYYFNPG